MVTRPSCFAFGSGYARLDPGIIILYADDATIDAVIALPQALAIPAPCPSGTVP